MRGSPSNTNANNNNNDNMGGAEVCNGCDRSGMTLLATDNGEGQEGSSPDKPKPRYCSDCMIGKKVRVFWPLDEQWYVGVVQEYDPSNGEHLLQYPDGDTEWVKIGENAASSSEKTAVKLDNEDANMDTISKSRSRDSTDRGNGSGSTGGGAGNGNGNPSPGPSQDSRQTYMTSMSIPNVPDLHRKMDVTGRVSTSPDKRRLPYDPERSQPPHFQGAGGMSHYPPMGFGGPPPPGMPHGAPPSGPYGSPYGAGGYPQPPPPYGYGQPMHVVGGPTSPGEERRAGGKGGPTDQPSHPHHPHHPHHHPTNPNASQSPSAPSSGNAAGGSTSGSGNGPRRKSGPKTWAKEEDALLLNMVQSMRMPMKWSIVAQSMPDRTGKQCRERYVNHLNPRLKSTDWSPSEDAKIFHLYNTCGSQWAKMSKMIPGRTDNGIKNRFHNLRRQLEREDEHRVRLSKPKDFPDEIRLDRIREIPENLHGKCDQLWDMSNGIGVLAAQSVLGGNFARNAGRFGPFKKADPSGEQCARCGLFAPSTQCGDEICTRSKWCQACTRIPPHMCNNLLRECLNLRRSQDEERGKIEERWDEEMKTVDGPTVS